MGSWKLCSMLCTVKTSLRGIMRVSTAQSVFRGVEGCLESCNGGGGEGGGGGLGVNGHGLASTNLLVSLLAVEGVIA